MLALRDKIWYNEQKDLIKNMKNLQKAVFGNEWGRFAYMTLDGYKRNAEQSTQKEAYKNLWDETTWNLDTLNEKTILNDVKIDLPFDSNPDNGKLELISVQLANMLGESGDWKNIKNYPKTKFVMKKLTERGFQINNPENLKDLKLVIENGEIEIDLSDSVEKEINTISIESPEKENK